MDKLSIQNLFKCNTGNNNSITVNTLINKKDDMFDIRKIIKAKEVKRHKIHNTYYKYYENCMKKIEIATTLGKNDLLYHVPSNINNILEYNSNECLAYIEKRIKSLYMDTHIVSPTVIFITWFYIEANIEKEKNKDNIIKIE